MAKNWDDLFVNGYEGYVGMNGIWDDDPRLSPTTEELIRYAQTGEEFTLTIYPYGPDRGYVSRCTITQPDPNIESFEFHGAGPWERIGDNG